MADPRFYKKKGPFTLGELAAQGQCEILRGDPSLVITDVAPLETAEPSHISLYSHPRFREALKTTEASACIVSSDRAPEAPAHLALLVAKYPTRTYGLIAACFYPQPQNKAHLDSTALVHPTATLGKDVIIGPHVVVSAHAEIGDGVRIDPFAFIGEGVVIGDNSFIESHVSLTHALLGNHVHIKPGARIGQGGFGFFMDSGDMGGHVPIPQLGRVIINDYVEIGANTTIDRGSGKDTVIGVGTRIDNLVQIAHNVELGKGCVMVAQVGIAGSTKFGDYVAAGGQVGITEHLNIGSFARIAAQSGIMHDVDSGEILMGSPAMPHKFYYRQLALLKKLAKDTRKKV